MNKFMQKKIGGQILSVGLIISFFLTSAGTASLLIPRHAQAQGIIDIVASGAQVLDGCENITGSKYEAIAAELGIDLQGGLKGGLTALGDELKGPGEDVGNAILGGLRDIGGQFADSAISDVMGSLGSNIGDAVANSGIADAISGIGGAALSAALPVVGGVLSGVVGGLLGGGGPEEVVEKGLRKLEQQGQKIALYEQQKMTQKERCLDALAQQAGQQALRDLTKQSVDWVQGGFTRFGEPGNPGFVQDSGQFLTDVTEDQYVKFIKNAGSESGGSFSGTCNFLRRPILESITTSYISESEPSGVDGIDGNAVPGSGGGCALTDADGLNMSADQSQAFLKGDFSAGGWSAFAQSVSDRGSSPVGAYLDQQEEVNTRVQEAKEQEREQLEWGQGFLADKEGGFTPASVVQGITERLVTSDINRLELIDEMGEIAGNLGKSLIGQLTGEGGDDESSESGLSNLDASETVGGDEGSNFEYLARSLADKIADQLEIEKDINSLLSNILPIYNNAQVDKLITSAQSCLEASNLSGSNADAVFANIARSQNTFRNIVIKNRMKVDWNGDPLSWRPIIKEENKKMVGWNGSDYNWKDDEVDRYYNQGTGEGCETVADAGNVSYVVTKEVIPRPEYDYSAVFFDLEPETDDPVTFVKNNDTNFLWLYSAEWGDSDKFENAGVYKVWEKQFCADADDDFDPQDSTGVHWQERLLAPDLNDGDDDDFADTRAGKRRAANARCDLAQGHEYCLAPTVRAPQIIRGSIYKENADGAVEPSSCSARQDAGTHYFVNSGEETWGTRECVVRSSPQGSAVEWEPGFPESTDSTDAKVYAPATSTNPVKEQVELVASLSNLLDRLELEDRDVLAIQQEFYAMEEEFNSEAAGDSLRTQTRSFIRNVRNLNQLLLDSAECSGGSSALSNFGATFLGNTENVDDTEEEDDTGESEELSISSFTARRSSSRFISVDWQASAASCKAESNPVISGWSGPVGPSGNQLITSSNSVRLTLVCERDGEEVAASRFVNQAGSGGDERFDPRR